MKYEKIVKEHNMIFVPFAMESLGGMDKDCETTLKRIGKGLADVDKMTAEAAISRLHDKVVFRWMRDLGMTLAYHAQQMSQKEALK